MYIYSVYMIIVFIILKFVLGKLREKEIVKY